MTRRTIMTDTEIGRRIRERRTELGMTQEALAERIGVTCQQVQRYEYGANRLNLEMVQQIANALSTPAEHFFRESNLHLQAPSHLRLNDMELYLVERYRMVKSRDIRELLTDFVRQVAAGEWREER